jgi:DNA polymerase-3 subunit gamma/tau
MEPTGKHNFLGIIKSKIGKLKSENTIEVTLDNKVQEEVLNDEKTNLLGYLKTQLENDKISITVEVTPLKEEDMKAYTAEDKFKKMVKKNPNLMDLKNKFDLEIDF